MNVLITGTTGQVGSYVADALRDLAHVHAPQREKMDLLSQESIKDAVRDVRPDWIVHAAAYTAVDRAETDRDVCFAVNAGATRTLAEEARRIDASLITFSTDYVFDGTADRPYREDDAIAPINTYGESKRIAEEALAASGCRYFNFRTSWVYSARGNNFVKTMLRLMSTRPELSVVSDQLGCPTSAADLAGAVATLVMSEMEAVANKTGTYHLAGQGETTWHGFARHIATAARRKRPDQSWTNPQPVPSAAYPTAAKRPANSRLDCTKAAERLGLRLPVWTESVDRVVDELLTQA